MSTAQRAPARWPPTDGDVSPGAQRVDSEVGRLRAVLVHRPGAELRAVTAGNAARMLFAGPVELARAQAEHDGLAAALRARHVEVVFVERLLAELLADGAPRRTRPLELLLPGTRSLARRQLGMLPASRIARSLIAGLDDDDGVRLGAGEAARLTPLPNLMFTRDPSVRVGSEMLVGAMAEPVRRREETLIHALFQLHPRFADMAVRSDTPHLCMQVEGGDVLLAGPGRVMVGISARTSSSAAYRFASALLGRGLVAEVLTIRMPRQAGLHLDHVVGQVDRDTFAVWAPARSALQAHAWRATSTGVAVHAVADPFSWLNARVLEIDARATADHRSWDHGINVLAVEPGVVVAYAENVEANAMLRAAGIDVVEVPGSALAAGRGGPRCLTCPIARDP